MYQLEINWENKHNNHGLLFSRPWKVAYIAQMGESQFVT